MRFDINVSGNLNVHHCYNDVVLCQMLQALKSIQHQQEKIMATQAELAAEVKAVTAKLTKIATESRTLVTKVDELLAIIANGPPVTAELQEAVNEAKAQAQVVDDIVPDAPEPPTPTL